MTAAWFELFAGAAIIDWVAVAGERKSLEYVFKPLAVAALIAAALTMEVDDAAQRAWFVAALGFSLGGDVFLMLRRDLFVAGLGSFLVAHLCYIAGFAVAGVSPVRAGAAAIVAVMVASVALRRILWSLDQGSKRALKAPVVAYAIAISAMVAAAVGAGGVVAPAGAVSFYVSDFLIAWSRFVLDFAGAKTLIIVTYHLAQLALVASLAP